MTILHPPITKIKSLYSSATISNSDFIFVIKHMLSRWESINHVIRVCELQLPLTRPGHRQTQASSRRQRGRTSPDETSLDEWTTVEFLQERTKISSCLYYYKLNCSTMTQLVVELLISCDFWYTESGTISKQSHVSFILGYPSGTRIIIMITLMMMMMMMMMMMLMLMLMMMMMQMLIMVITKLRMIMRKGAGTHDGPTSHPGGNM